LKKKPPKLVNILMIEPPMPQVFSEKKALKLINLNEYFIYI